MRSILLTVALAVATTLSAQRTFPTIEGETVDGEKITLPKSDPKTFTIVGLAYSPKASDQLDEWLEPAYMRFVAKHGLFAGEYDADIYFMPVFAGTNKVLYEPSMKKFKKTASPEIVEHVLFAKSDLEMLRDELDMPEKEVPHFFILDRDGKIVYRIKGPYTLEKLEEMEEVLLQ